MIAIETQVADDAWRRLVGKLRTLGKNQDGRDQLTKELVHVSVELRDPRQRITFSRAINPAFAIAEVIWILAGADDVSFLSFWNPRMKRYSDDGIRLCGAYGYRLGSQPKIDPDLAQELRHWAKVEEAKPVDQLRSAYDALIETPNSRQIVLQMWNVLSDMPSPHSRSKDVPCNLTSHLMIREGKLEWLQVMRSNDLFWGFPYNLIQFTTLQEIMAGWLNIDLGSYVHVSDSLHVYQRHWKDLDSVNTQAPLALPSNKADLRISSYSGWESVFSQVVRLAFKLTKATSTEALTAVFDKARELPEAYAQWVALLTAEALRKRGHEGLAVRISESSGPYLQTSWKNWVARRETEKALAIPATVS